MKRTYTLKGMKCGGCVGKVQDAIEQIPGVSAAEVQLEKPQVSVFSDSAIPMVTLREALLSVGEYELKEFDPPLIRTTELPEKSLSTYQPLIIIVSFIAGVSLLSQFPFSSFSTMLWMRHFMAGFFIVFAFFKLLNLKGFANAYGKYDLVAEKWKSWGFIYPFVELVLGVLYLINSWPIGTNIATALILGVSSVGVIKSNLDKKKIKCACLGDVFNLPMSKVTIVEDLTMVAMSVFMLLQYKII